MSSTRPGRSHDGRARCPQRGPESLGHEGLQPVEIVGTIDANLHLLFWLSLVPFVTAWMGENHFAEWPVAAYGFVQLMAGVAYYVLGRALASHHGTGSRIATALGADRKGLASMALYATAIPAAFLHPWVALGLYMLVAVLWLVPDRRMEGTPADRG